MTALLVLGGFALLGFVFAAGFALGRCQFVPRERMED